MNLIPYRKGELMGYSDYKKNLVIEPQYRHASFFSEGLSQVWINELSYNFNEKNETFKNYSTSPLSFKNGFSQFQKDCKWGVLDRQMNVIIQAQYQAITNLDEGYATYWEGANARGIIDFYGNKVSILCECLSNYKNGFVIAGDKSLRNEKYYESLLNKFGVEIYTASNISPFSEGLSACHTGTFNGYVDMSGKYTSLKVSGKVGDFSCGFAVTMEQFRFNHRSGISDNYNFINHDFELLSPEKYFHYVSRFSEGFAIVSDKVNGLIRSGFLNTRLEVVIDIKYQKCNCFHEGLASVKIDDKWGYINYKGDLAIDNKYNSAGDFKNGFAYVTIKNQNYRLMNIREYKYKGDEIGFYINKDGLEYFEL